MQVTFKNVRKDDNVITAEGNHNCGEHLFTVRLEGADCVDSENLKLFTDPPEYKTKMFVIKGAVSLLYEVFETGQDYIEETGFIYSMG